jgi:hypothetical protein
MMLRISAERLCVFFCLVSLVLAGCGGGDAAPAAAAKSEAAAAPEKSAAAQPWSAEAFVASIEMPAVDDAGKLGEMVKLNTQRTVYAAEFKALEKASTAALMSLAGPVPEGYTKWSTLVSAFSELTISFRSKGAEGDLTLTLRYPADPARFENVTEKIGDWPAASNANSTGVLVGEFTVTVSGSAHSKLGAAGVEQLVTGTNLPAQGEAWDAVRKLTALSQAQLALRDKCEALGKQQTEIVQRHLQSALDSCGLSGKVHKGNLSTNYSFSLRFVDDAKTWRGTLELTPQLPEHMKFNRSNEFKGHPALLSDGSKNIALPRLRVSLLAQKHGKKDEKLECLLNALDLDALQAL